MLVTVAQPSATELLPRVIPDHSGECPEPDKEAMSAGAQQPSRQPNFRNEPGTKRQISSALLLDGQAR